MSEEYVIQYCSPTMAGIKTGSLFTCPIESKEQMAQCMAALNAKLLPKGIVIMPVKYMKKRVLIYMYRRNALVKDLQNPIAREILKSLDYPVDDISQCITKLVLRINTEEEFPHEVGLFLSYPPEDVKAFIDNHAQNAKLVGTWKVYYNEDQAKRTFLQFENCTKAYCENYKKYNSFDRLVVSCS
ncbi:MAG: DUF3793 family protein [Lachnospiraceae bacterium]|nr:DUF3793 family protein [Lachnospiraceae bacterium]